MKPEFPTTDWSMIFAINVEIEPEERERAREQLYLSYRKPIKKSVEDWLQMNRGRLSDAEDLTQDFFRAIYEKDLTKNADPARGRLRSYLIVSLKNFLSNDARSRRAQKRGGGEVLQDVFTVPIAENPQDQPDQIFDQRWALRLIEISLDDLRIAYRRLGKPEIFETLHPELGERGATELYQEMAQKLDISAAQVSSEMYQLRRRYRNYIRARLRETLLDPNDLEDELRYFKQLLARH